jgi:hypothetical protein
MSKKTSSASVGIINKSNRKVPYEYTPPPVFKTKYEEDKYYDEEYRRWVEGYNGLTGKHYAYLNIGSIKTVTGEIIRPRFRDGDQFVFENHEESIKYQQDEMIIKRREFGLTSIFGGFMPIYNCLIEPGSVNILTSADKFRVKGMFSSKTMVMYENLPLPERMIPPQKYTRIDGFLSLGQGDKIGDGSEVWCLETADSDQAAKKMESFRAKSIFLDELFLHPRATQVLSSAQASILQGFVKKGHITLGGSCGAETEAEALAMKSNSAMIEKFWKDADHLGIRATFIPGTLCIDEAPELNDNGLPTGKIIKFMENGYSLEDKAKDWIIKTRDRLEKAEDKTRYYTFIKNYPLAIEEVFEINRMGILSQDIYASLDFAKRKIHSEDTDKTYSLRMDSKTQQVEAAPSKKGVYHISSLPDPNKTYISGTDPIPFGDRDISQGSDYALCVKCIEDQEYVAYYAERNLDSDAVIDNAIMLQKLYKSKQFPEGAPTMLESNRGEVVLKGYKDRGELNLLANRPDSLGIIYQNKKSGKGWSNNDKTGPRANNYFIQFLKEYADRIRLLRIIEECAAFPNGNTDVIDAIKSCEILEADLQEKDKKKTKAGVRYSYRRYYTREKGKVVEKWKKIEIS